MEVNAKLTVLCDGDVVRIRVYDDTSGIEFVRMEVAPDQFVAALGRMGRVPAVKAEVFRLDCVGKAMLVDKLKFPMPDDSGYRDKDAAVKLAKELCPDGWDSNFDFGSQGSFFDAGGVRFAKCMIRKWVEPGCEEHIENMRKRGLSIENL